MPMNYPAELLRNLYQTMVRIRFCEESLVEPILSGEIRTPCHLYSGQEAIAAGVCAALTPEDYVFGNHRSHGHFIAKGGSIRDLISEIYCKETGCCRGRGGSMHVVSPEHGMMGAAPIVAGTISLALGAALAIQIRSQERTSVSFFGDGATGEGVLYESMNFAALKKLPLLFVCENNLYSTHLPISECRPDIPIFEVAKPFGITSLRLDGNDVLAVHEAAIKSRELCINGKGPVFIECLTYRLRGHVGPDDNIQGCHTDIRPLHELKEWQENDPIQRFERYLLDGGYLDERALKEIRYQAEQEVKEAQLFAKNCSYPKTADLDKYVFAEVC